jgi:hypothetical protein
LRPGNALGSPAPPFSILSQCLSHYRNTIAQATTLAYIDTFTILAVIGAAMFLLSFALKKNDPRAGGEVAVG